MPRNNFTRGEGADGFFLKTLTETLGRLGAIPVDKHQAIRDAYHAAIFKDQRAVEHTQDAMRHEGIILERLLVKVPAPVVAAPVPVVAPAPTPALPKASITVPTGSEPPDTYDFGDFDIEPDPVNPYTLEGGPLAMVLDEWANSRQHPFVRTISIGKKEYTVVGTAVVHGLNETVNINCTTGSFKKIRECDEKILVHFNGRAVSMSRDTEGGTAFWVWLCHYTPGKVFRFWMNRNTNGVRHDDPKGTFRVLITKEPPGWRKVVS